MEPGIGFRKMPVPGRSLGGDGLSRPWRPEPGLKLALYKPIRPTPRCCRTGFPLLENAATRRSGCRGPRRVIQTAAAHGLFRSATDQRPRARLDLRPDRHRLHHGLWHRRHDQFRSWRHFHDRRLHRADLVPGAGLVRADRRPGDPADRAAGVDGDHRAVWLDGGAHRLPAAAALVPAGADAVGDRHVVRADQLLADRAGRAGQAGAADHHRRLHPAGAERLRGAAVQRADRRRRHHHRAAGDLHLAGGAGPGSAATCAPASRTRPWRRCSGSTSTAPSP